MQQGLWTVADELAEDWAKSVYKKLLDEMKKKKLDYSGELQDSLQVVVNKNNDDWPSVTISFGNYGRFVEMKNLYYSKHPPIQVLKDWVASKGISKFKFIPGYQGRKTVPTRDIAISRIAWAVATARRYGGVSNQYGKNVRRKVWKQRTLGKAVAHLNHLVAETMATTTQEIIKASFN